MCGDPESKNGHRRPKMGAHEWERGEDDMSQSQPMGEVKVLLSQTYPHQHGKREIRFITV